MAAAETETPPRARDRRIMLALFLAGFAAFSLLYSVQPLLPVFAGEFGVGATVASLALSLSTGLLAGTLLVAGALSEAVGRRGLMFASLCGAAVLDLGVAAAPGWALVLVLRAALGVVLAGVPSVAMAYLAEEIGPERLGLAMGLYVGGTAFGGMVGRVGTAALAARSSWRTALAVVGAVDVVVAVSFALLLPPSRHFVRRAGLGLRYHVAAFGRQLRQPRLRLLFVAPFVLMGCFVTVYNYATFRLTAPPYGLDAGQVGLIFTAYLLGIAGSSLAGALADRLGRRPVLVAGVLIAGAGLALTAFAPLAVVIAGIAVLTIGFFGSHAVTSGSVGRLAGAEKAHAASLYLLGYYLGSSVLGSLGGWFWESGGWPAVLAMTGTLLAIALGIALALGDL